MTAFRESAARTMPEPESPAQRDRNELLMTHESDGLRLERLRRLRQVRTGNKVGKIVDKLLDKVVHIEESPERPGEYDHLVAEEPILRARLARWEELPKDGNAKEEGST